jgi:precorrin-6Y C5,15-methyltransferase (decarboxylating)
MIPIHVVGIGLEGAAGLTETVRQMVEQATLLVGSARHLSYFPDHPADRLLLTDLTETIAQLRHRATCCSPAPPLPVPPPLFVILTSGDPLFFGLGRLLLQEFPAEQLTFHPHVSSIQLAFSRVKLPWQDARLISAHGRSLEELTQALQQGAEKLAVLTDGTSTPAAIARLLQSLDLPMRYRLWVCENLGGKDERIVATEDPAALQEQSFAPLNVVVLQRLTISLTALDTTTLPLFGIPDSLFLSFPDRPGLITKREVRVQILSELALQPGQIVWDIGAGTGSVAIEIARLCPTSTVYAIEKTAIGISLIQQNSQRFQLENIIPVYGTAPDALHPLPRPDRIFIGGSGGNLPVILDYCAAKLVVGDRIVLALATLEHLTMTLNWLQKAGGKVEGRRAEDGERRTESGGRNFIPPPPSPIPFPPPPLPLHSYLLQVQLARSLPFANLTRFSPLNPVTLVVIEPESGGGGKL